MKALMQVQRGAVRRVMKTLADGNEYPLYYLVRVPEEITRFYSAQKRFPDSEEGDLARQKHRAKFIAESLCNEDGSPFMTLEEAMLTPVTLRVELCDLITDGSNKPVESGKV